MASPARQRTVGWLVLALVGLALAVALSVAASNLSTQPIGLSGEPLQGGERLAPVGATVAPRRPDATTPGTRARATPVAPGRQSRESDDDGAGGAADHDDD